MAPDLSEAPSPVDRRSRRWTAEEHPMGMDVIGRRPRSSTGEHFRNNVWWWRPLWEYCAEVTPAVCDDVLGHSNDGDGLPADGARRLARILREEIASGRCAAYAQARAAHLRSLPRQDCRWCGATGIRGDAVGTEHGMVDKVLGTATARRVGRTHGWCNGCGGLGTCAHPEAGYPFSVDNVAAFAAFLEDCGGFVIC